jgi:glycine hydroxymethyltransferase
MDDVMIYRLSRDNYMMVVNALNREKIKAWLRAVNSRQFIIDKDNPEKEVEGRVKIEISQKVDLALQGPNSLTILQKLTKGEKLEKDIRDLGKNEFLETRLRGIKVLISRSGYTGEEIGYELYFSSQDALRAWNLVLEKGRELGIKPAGLGARDSARIEAGLPLYGQELAGGNNISPLEAGYPAFLKFHKPFFIGREVLLKKRVKKEIIRFKMKAKGVRKINPRDKVLNEKGQYIGEVTSATLVKGIQMGMAYIDKNYTKEGTTIRINEKAVVLSRFSGENKR